jgi:multicomponent Na+:H+ antiporter subunit C
MIPFALLVGLLYATGMYLMMRRSIVKLAIGLTLLSHAANLLIFSVAGLTREAPPLIPEGAATFSQPVADPLPQALVLTAIVIGFGVLAFTIVLIHRTAQTTATEDISRLTTTDS